MMDNTQSGLSWLWVLFVIIVIWAVFGGGIGGNTWGNRGNYDTYANNNGCRGTSGCEIERQEIIDSAQTRYLIEQQGAQTRAETMAGINSLYDQANRIYIQGLQTEAFDLKLENQALKNQIYNDTKFAALTSQVENCCCGFNRRLDGIEANMLTKPVLSGMAATAYGQMIPANVYGGRCGATNNI